MADKVLLHVGLPKTGTTYLQSILWANKAALAEQGLLLPGASAREHMWASLVVREHPSLDRRHPGVRYGWSNVLSDLHAWPGTAVVSHEFFGGATAGQVKRALTDLAGPSDAEVHLVVTGRDVLSLVNGYWQEHVKHGHDLPLDDFPDAAAEPWDEWGWSTLDIRSVLERWAEPLPPERVHVLVLDQTAPRETLWLRFAGLLGVDPTGLDTRTARENRSLGLVEAELMRRISRDLHGFASALDRGVWLRGYLAHDKLVPRGGERFLPSPVRVEQLRELAAEQVDYLRNAGFDVRGEVQRLAVPEELPPLRHPQDVTDTEMLAVATSTIASIITDTRAFRRENTQLRKELQASSPESRPGDAPE